MYGLMKLRHYEIERRGHLVTNANVVFQMTRRDFGASL